MFPKLPLKDTSEKFSLRFLDGPNNLTAPHFLLWLFPSTSGFGKLLILLLFTAAFADIKVFLISTPFPSFPFYRMKKKTTTFEAFLTIGKLLVTQPSLKDWIQCSGLQLIIYNLWGKKKKKGKGKRKAQGRLSQLIFQVTTPWRTLLNLFPPLLIKHTGH